MVISLSPSSLTASDSSTESKKYATSSMMINQWLGPNRQSQRMRMELAGMCR